MPPATTPTQILRLLQELESNARYLGSVALEGHEYGGHRTRMAALKAGYLVRLDNGRFEITDKGWTSVGGR